MELRNRFGERIDEDYAPIIADVFPRMGLSIDPVTLTEFNGGDEYDGVVFALNLAAHEGYRVPEHILAPIADEIRNYIDGPDGDKFDRLAMRYIEQIRALDNA